MGILSFAGKNNPRYVVGCDFGQTNDPSTVAVVERALLPVGEPTPHVAYRRLAGGDERRVLLSRQRVEEEYHLRRLDRVPLRTSYTAIARGIVNLLKQLASVQDEAGEKVTIPLAIDEGGVGKAVRDILLQELKDGITPESEAGRRLDVRLLPITVHGGSNVSYGQGWIHLPKRDLVGAGVVAFQNGLLKIGNLKHRDDLEEELANYRLKQNLSTSHVAFEPLRSGQHDDLLFATCLALWAWRSCVKRVEHVDSDPLAS